MNFPCSVTQGEPLPSFTQLVPDPDIWERLTKRERQVFCSLADGMTDKQIASRYDISPNTVKVHVRRLYKASGAVTRTGLVAKVCRTKAPVLIASLQYAHGIVSREIEGRAA